MSADGSHDGREVKVEVPPTFTAFEGLRKIAAGDLKSVALEAKRVLDCPDHQTVLIFADATSHLTEVDFRGTPSEVLERLEGGMGEPISSRDAGVSGKRGPGRPKLGVVGREVTLLPRHWEWLDDQPGGASVALRKLVEASRRSNSGHKRKAQESVYRFMAAMAGNLPGYEEALRAFYAGKREAFEERMTAWPKDIRDHVLRLAEAVWEMQAVGGSES